MTCCLRVGPTLAALLLLVPLARAQPPRTLRWGGDKGGGAPYIYDNTSGKLVGFEVDLANYLAAQLGLRRLGATAEQIDRERERVHRELGQGSLGSPSRGRV